MAISLNTGEAWLGEWLWKDVFYRIVAGVISGFILGKGIAFLMFKIPDNKNYARAREGFVAISTILFVYGLTELLSGYGFIAVFVAAVTIRNSEMNHEYHKELHWFTDQTEKILLVVLLILFGGSLKIGILNSLTWPMALAGIAFVILIRPLSGWIGLIGTGLRKKQKIAISFFGIKGIGSFFYLSFALTKADFPYTKELWSLVAFVVLISILVHGLTASFGMKKLGLRYSRDSVKSTDKES